MPKKSSVCLKCGIYIEFVETKNGKFMPVNPILLTFITPAGEIKKGYIPHWSTCNDPDYFRKKAHKIAIQSVKKKAVDN